MALTEMTILGYRGFRKRGALKFADPNGNDGSGLTVITGPNNAGKSSILECMRARSGNTDVSFTAGTRNSLVESVEISYTINGKKESVKSLTKGSSETVKTNVDPNFSVLVLPSRRAFSPYFGKSEFSRSQYVDHNALPPQRAPTLSAFEYRLFNTLKAPEPFNSLLREVVGFEPTWTIDKADHGQHFLKFFNGNQSHSSDGMGEGIISIFAIIDALYDSKPGGVIVIDEPELSLHPSLQKRLAKLFARFAKDRQIVISTHSPYFVDLRALDAGGQIARVITSENGTKIHQITTRSIDAIRRLSAGNLYNPHVFGLDARELFFQEDKIILTEGQEDVLLYPLVAEQVGATLSGNFFGWGAGGAGNIPYLCIILKDLGFKMVAVLFDGDKKEDAAKLRVDFPDYFIDCIPAKDIRTKGARKATIAIAGLLDEQLKLKPEHAKDMAQIFANLEAKMSSPRK